MGGQQLTRLESYAKARTLIARDKTPAKVRARSRRPAGISKSTMFCAGAQSQGSFDPSVDARVLARSFVSVAQGLNVMHKAVADRAVLKDAVRSRNKRQAS
jgi:hypothetical protein